MSRPITQIAQKVYLDDGIYAAWDAELVCVELTAEHGGGPSDTIYLDPDVMARLIQQSTQPGWAPPGGHPHEFRAVIASDDGIEAIDTIRLDDAAIAILFQWWRQFTTSQES